MAQSFADAISAIESGGNYASLGPLTRGGDRAYGRYQVMGANVGPWTRQHLGRELSPQEFLANPQAQDAVFNAQFGQYVKKYGPEGAARAWFAGEGGMNDPNRKDVLGTSVADYGRKFMAGMPADAPSPSFIGPPAPVGMLGPDATANAAPAAGQPGAMPGLLGMLTGQKGQQQAPGAGLGALGMSLMAPQMQKMMTPDIPPPMPRRHIDLTSLQAMLQQQPRFGAFSWS